MDLHPSDTEEAVRSASEEYLRDTLPLAEARGRPAGTWRGMAEMGWFGIALPEEAGGIGLSLGSEALVFAELGRHLAPLGAIAAAVAVDIAHRAGNAALAEAIMAGEAHVALGLPQPDGNIRALDAEGAGLLTVVAEDSGAIHAVPEDWSASGCLDLSSTQAVIASPTAAPLAAIDGSRAALHQRIAAAAFALGCGEAARDMAAAYAQTREQFGQPIGAFQGVKHPCADMAVRCSAARAQLLYAAIALEDGTPDCAFQVAVAKKLADAAALNNGRGNIQVHGGMGMTDECDAHLVLKRAHTLQFISPSTARMLLAA
jgi:alkylation response protein AidB-like acyl-CoA dehydrogenase